MSQGKLIMILLATINLTSCAYSSKFSCPDAKGARCMRLSEVNRQVDSGEIDKIHEPKKGLFGGCLFGGCKADGKNEVPLLKTEPLKAKVVNDGDRAKNAIYLEGDYLYVK